MDKRSIYRLPCAQQDKQAERYSGTDLYLFIREQLNFAIVDEQYFATLNCPKFKRDCSKEIQWYWTKFIYKWGGGGGGGGGGGLQLLT